jgi:hypothetical protein
MIGSPIKSIDGRTEYCNPSGVESAQPAVAEAGIEAETWNIDRNCLKQISWESQYEA